MRLNDVNLNHKVKLSERKSALKNALVISHPLRPFPHLNMLYSPV